MSFDYQGARKAGYSDEEISGYIAEQKPDFDMQGALEAGYSPSEISEFVFQEKERSPLQKAGRAAAQYGVGAVEGAAMIPDFAALASKGFVKSPGVKETLLRQNLFEDIEQMAIRKQAGDWSDEDEKFFTDIQETVQNPEALKKFAQEPDIPFDSASIIEKAAERVGVDLQPEGFLEHATRWAGFIKNPSKWKEIFEVGAKAASNPVYWAKKAKALLPTLGEGTRGLLAATAMEIAAENELGPIGQMSATIAGDLIGGGLAGAGKSALRIAKSPGSIAQKLGRSVGKGQQFFSSKANAQLRKELVKQFEEAGIQADLGSITNNNFLRMIQARLAASGLTGKALENLREDLKNQFVDQYKEIADGLGELKYGSLSEAGEALVTGLEEIKNADLKTIREYYKRAREVVDGQESLLASASLVNSIEDLTREVLPGSIKSPETKKVMESLSSLLEDVMTESGSLKKVSIPALVNNKINLKQLIDYEVQGGSKQLLKKLVKDIDDSLIDYGKRNNREFLRNYVTANKRFGAHAKAFRANRDVNTILKMKSPQSAMNKMNSVEGIKALRKAYSMIPGGEKVFNDIARSKLENILMNNMVDGISNQFKFGTFANVLSKGKNREIIKELLDQKSFNRLVKLQKSSGQIANSAQKFLNTSKSTSVAIDAAAVTKIFKDMVSLFGGNPWPIAHTGSVLVAGRTMANLIANPEFLKGVEEAIKYSSRNDLPSLMRVMERIGPIALEAEREAKSSNKEESY